MIDSLTTYVQWNIVTIVLALIVLYSLWQGVGRGASGSMRHLLFIVAEAGLTILSLYIASQVALGLSPSLADWLHKLDITIPNRELAWWENMYYTFITSLRDMSLMRFATLMLVSYVPIRILIGWIASYIYMWTGITGARDINTISGEAVSKRFRQVFSRLVGGLIGLVTGIVRVVIVVALLFIFVTLQPDGKISQEVQASNVYQYAVAQLVEPLMGEWVTEQVPIFTASVEKQLSELMQRKYEVIDHLVPADIEQAALAVTKDAKTDEEKARKLYDWVGSRVRYDWDKANTYIETGEWKEQTPQDTFQSRTGVCIDYARLYAMMGRSVGLEVKVVTGTGYVGNGGYGPHAWNIVKIGPDEWIPLDTTWASTGDWFNPPNFDASHVPDLK
ncbi:transglutaminase domain-containing protein [Paenibacillus marinisediminis]